MNSIQQKKIWNVENRIFLVEYFEKIRMETKNERNFDSH